MTRTAIMIASIGTALLAAPLTAATANAARCPSGQFYRVSKKICQDKAIGIKLGIYKSGKSRKLRKAKTKIVKPARSVDTLNTADKGIPVRSAVPVSAAKAPKNPPAAMASHAAVQPVRQPDNPLDAIIAAAPGSAAKPIVTRMVKAMYFTNSGLASPIGAGDPEIGTRAVLNLLKSRLESHVDRFRSMYLRRVADEG